MSFAVKTSLREETTEEKDICKCSFRNEVAPMREEEERKEFSAHDKSKEKKICSVKNFRRVGERTVHGEMTKDLL
jgi:hypothetical protein